MGVSSTPDVADQTQRWCHDVRQYVAAGAILAEAPGDEELRPDVRQRLEKLRRVFELVSDMVDAHAGAAAAAAGPVDLAVVTAECLEVITATAAVPVVATIRGTTIVSCDSVRLRRAVGNVLSNAVRAAGSDGSVQVHVGEETPHLACVQVDDDGAGYGLMPAVGGHGMSVVGSVVHECNGRLEIFSGPGPGTTVRLLFPTATGRVAP